MQKRTYEMRISDWSSDGCSSDLEKRNRRRRIEPKAKEYADDVHLPGPVHAACDRTENAVEHPAVLQGALKLLFIELPIAHAPEQAPDGLQGKKIDCADEQQEYPRNQDSPDSRQRGQRRLFRRDLLGEHIEAHCKQDNRSNENGRASS